MKLHIKGNEVELAYTFRALMVYENITGKSFKIGGTLTDMMYLFFSMIQGSLMKNKIDVVFEWEEFLDYLDENPNSINEFSDWIVSVMNSNSFITAKNPSPEKGGGSKKKLPEE